MTSESHVDGRPRLDFLHGVRGLAALTIVLFHATLHTRVDSVGPVIRTLNVALLHGYLAVPVFLVLSGFLLAIPVVANGLVLRGGVRGFLWRRALRILPPYYAAYLLDMLFFAVAGRLAGITGRDPGEIVRHQVDVGYHWPSIVAHVLLVHNMNAEWVRGMDGNFWSIACEWQIYMLFAIALVPLWRFAGLGAMLAFCVLLAAVVTFAIICGTCFYMIPWMLPIFGIGAAAAAVVFGPGSRAAALRRWPWAAISLATGCLMVAGIVLLDASVPAQSTRIPVQYYRVSMQFRWIYDVLAALATAAVVVWLALGWRDGARAEILSARIRGFLESRCLQGLGRFSYSLYLTHGMVFAFVSRATWGLWSLWLVHWAAVVIGGAVLSLVVGYVFHRCFEYRFLASETRGMFVARRESSAGPSGRVGFHR